jgi:hypothetical protein
MHLGTPLAIGGQLAIRLWPSTRVTDAPIARLREAAV